jgi:parallel beta-helix repeat protein
MGNDIRRNAMKNTMLKIIGGGLVIALLLAIGSANAATHSFGDIIVKGPWIDSRAYPSINDACVAGAAAGKTVKVFSPQTLAASLTATCALEIEKGGKIVKASAYTLTINGPFQAGLYQVFDGFSAGEVTGLKEAYSEWFGAAGDGTTDDTAAIAKTVAAISAEGVLRFSPSATYYFGGAHLTRNITVDLNGATLKATTFAGGVSKRMFYSEAVDAVGRIEISNGKINGNGSTRGTGITDQNSLIDIVGAGTVIIRDIEQYSHAAGISSVPNLLNDRTLSAIRIKGTSRVIVDKIVMHDNWNEQLWVQDDNATSRVSITNSQWYNGQVNPGNTPITITNAGSAIVEGNTIIDSNCSAMNLLTKNAIVRGNYIENVASSHAIDLSEGLFYADDSIIENNIIKNSDGAGILVMGSRIKIRGNTISGCTQGVHVSSSLLDESGHTYGDWCASTYEDHEDILIEGNTIIDTNYTSSITGNAILVRHTASGKVFKGVNITGNYIYQPGANVTKALKNGVYIDSVQRLDISGNRIYDFETNAIQGCGGPVSYLMVKGNRISSRGHGTQDHIIMSFSGDALQHEYIENVFEEIPTPGRYNINILTATLDIVSLVNNAGISKCNIPSANLFYRKDNYPTATSTPSSGTYNLFDIVKKSPVAGSVEGYVMVGRPGTLGTLNGGATTGSITAGSYTLTVNDATGLSAGNYISIAGAGSGGSNLATMVTAVSGTTITIWNAAVTSVTGAAISYSGPDVKTLGAIGS